MTKIQLIIIGNELLNGKITDQNTHWLANFCYEQNLELTKVQIVGDNAKDFNCALNEAYQNSDIILTSGGLGPTKDDLTKSMVASFFNKNIAFNERAWKTTLSHYERVGKEVIKEHTEYGMIPEDFFVFYNPVGFAPGLGYVTEEKKLIACMPGVPSEFQSMFSEEIFSFIQKQRQVLNHYKHVIVKTFKIHESKIFSELVPGLWDELEKFGEVSSLPHAAGVDIAVKLTENDLEKIQLKEKEVLNLICNSNLKPYIWHIGPESIEEVIVQKAQEKGLKIGFAESCTGGLLAHRITNVAGSSSVFWGSIISYANDVKINSLNVQESTLNDFGAVSIETAKEMAIGALNALNVDIAISTTGIAGPGGGSVQKPVGTIGIGFATKESHGSKLYHFRGNRESLKFSFSQKALFSLLDIINKI